MPVLPPKNHGNSKRNVSFSVLNHMAVLPRVPAKEEITIYVFSMAECHSDTAEGSGDYPSFCSRPHGSIVQL